MIRQLSGLRPGITFDSLTGQPVVQLDVIEEEAPLSVEKIFEFISKYEKRIILAFDEFQQIIHYPAKNTQALLQSHIQDTRNLSCVFSGSQRNILASMFEAYSQPFYQSTDMLYLNRKDPEEYKNFIYRKFKTGGKTLAKRIPELILEKPGTTPTMYSIIETSYMLRDLLRLTMK